MWRVLLAGGLALFLALAPVPIGAAASEGRVQTGTFTFPATGTPTCVPFADVGFVVCGLSGTVDYHLVFTPSGNENSWFNVQDFTGTVYVLCPTFPVCPQMSFAHESAMVLVHLGPDRPDFILVNHSSVPVDHRVTLP